MACFNPLVAFRGKHPNAKTGKLPMVFSPRDSFDPDTVIKLPCGRCIGCRLEKSRQWAIRCVHEASLYEKNCFITLTFNPENLPKSGSLDKRDFQLFMKRLRKRFGAGPRYFHCGEYGELCKNCGNNRKRCFYVCKEWVPKLGRPHYHACIFNFDFDDKELHEVTKSGSRLYRSKALEELWPFGFSTVGDVTFESAAYVARYCTKKITGGSAVEHYETVDSKTGEVWSVLPEYTTMSRRPGIGRPWLEKFASDVYPHDRVVLRGKELRPPKYYDSVFEVANPDEFDDVKEMRKQKSVSFAKDSVYERLRVREEITEINVNKLNRSYENES